MVRDAAKRPLRRTPLPSALPGRWGRVIARAWIQRPRRQRHLYDKRSSRDLQPDRRPGV